jgi:hypothetical protein
MKELVTFVIVVFLLYIIITYWQIILIIILSIIGGIIGICLGILMIPAFVVAYAFGVDNTYHIFLYIFLIALAIFPITYLFPYLETPFFGGLALSKRTHYNLSSWIRNIWNNRKTSALVSDTGHSKLSQYVAEMRNSALRIKDDENKEQFVRNIHRILDNIMGDRDISQKSLRKSPLNSEIVFIRDHIIARDADDGIIIKRFKKIFKC